MPPVGIEIIACIATISVETQDTAAGLTAESELFNPPGVGYHHSPKFCQPMLPRMMLEVPLFASIVSIR